MNGFVIAVGSSVKALTELALQAGQKIDIIVRCGVEQHSQFQTLLQRISKFAPALAVPAGLTIVTV